MSTIAGRFVSMHRLILGAADGIEVDHVDMDGLNNRRSNLRLATHAENMANKKVRRDSVSGFKGVAYRAETGRWRAKVGHKGIRHHIGYYNTPEDAARAYDQRARELFGEFARLNFPDPR